MMFTDDAKVAAGSIGPYAVRGVLGSGGMGVVYRAHDQERGCEVAVKVLRKQDLTGVARERFLREARLAAVVRHPNVAAVYGTGVHEETDYIVMELVEGRPLQHCIPKGGMDVPLALELGRQIAEGMQAAHEAGVVHRDLKPGNTLVTADGVAKVVDFGIATRLRTEDLPAETLTRELTREGHFIGTIAYMAPEQARGENVDHRADIFSFGVLMHQMLTSDLPFPAPNPVAMIASMQRDPPRRVRLMNRSVPPALEALVLKALSKRPSARFQSMAEIVQALRQAQSNRSFLVFESHSGESLVDLPEGPETATTWEARPPMIGSERTSIAVIPLRCLTGHPDDPYIAAGISEDIMRALTGIPGLRVAPALAAFQYKEGNADPNSVALALNTRYIFSGSFRRMDNRLRVTGQLTDGIQRSLLWSQNYDRAMEDVFAVQDELARSVVRSLSGQLIRADVEMANRTPTDSLDAWGLARKAYYIWNSAFTVEGVIESVELLRRAVEIDPDYALAHAHLGLYVIQSVIHRISQNRPVDRATALYSAERAVQLAPRDPEVLAQSSIVFLHTSHYEIAVRNLRHAVEIAPYDLVAWGYLSFGHACAGGMKELKEAARILMQLITDAPDHPSLPYWMQFATIACLRLERFEDACYYGNRAVELQPGFVFNQVLLAEALVRHDEMEQARKVLSTIPLYNPMFNLEQFVETANSICREPAYVEQLCGQVRSLGLLR